MTEQEIVNLFKKKGISFKRKNLIKTVSYKSISDYVKIINKLPRKKHALYEINEIYKLDIKIRRLVLKLSSFIEVHVRSCVKNVFYNNNVFLDKHSVEYSLMKDFSEEKQLLKYWNGYKKEKIKIKIIHNYFDTISFFAINRVFRLVKVNLIHNIFENSAVNFAYLERVRRIRNSAAHNNILFLKYDRSELFDFVNALNHLLPIKNNKDILTIKKLIKKLYLML